MDRRKSRFRTSDSAQPPHAPQETSDNGCDLRRTFGPAIAVACAGFVVAWLCMAPAPPKEVTIAAGHRDGAYYRYCTQYAESLAENGITLHVRETRGSVENYELLLQEDDVDIAIVQGGTAPRNRAARDLESIACVYPEPLWIFCRGDKILSDIRELKGLRVAVGPVGSGTRRMADQVLQQNGLTAADQSFHPDARTGFAAATALRGGELDAAFFVTTADAGYITELIRSPGVNLLNLERQQAYAQLYPWVQPISLAQGVVDLQADLPAQNVQMIAPSARALSHLRTCTQPSCHCS